MIFLLEFYYVIPFILLVILVETEFFKTVATGLIGATLIYGFIHRHDIVPYVQNN